MAKLNVEIAHQLGTSKAIERINFGLTQIPSTFGNLASVEQASWSGNVLSWTVRVTAARVNGTTTVTDDAAHLEADLPLVVSPFTSRVEAAVQKYGTMLLAAPSTTELQQKPEQRKLAPEVREEIRQRAVAAARASGHRWGRLSQEERQSFKDKAREELEHNAPR